MICRSESLLRESYARASELNGAHLRTRWRRLRTSTHKVFDEAWIPRKEDQQQRKLRQKAKTYHEAAKTYHGAAKTYHEAAKTYHDEMEEAWLAHKEGLARARKEGLARA